MASLFSTAIVAMCVSAQGQYNTACEKALDAGTRQLGWRQQVDKAEDMAINYTNAQAMNRLDDREEKVIAAMLFVYKTAHDKRLVFKLPKTSYYSSASNEITPDSYKFVVTWKF